MKINQTAMLFIALVLSVASLAQDIDYARSIITSLTSPEMAGRGYLNGGDRKAGLFIQSEYEKLGLIPLGEDYLQEYRFAINTIVGKLTVATENETLVPGIDFVVSSSSPTTKGTYELVWMMNAEDSLNVFSNKETVDLSNTFVVTSLSLKELELANPYESRGVIILRDSTENMWWHVSSGYKVNDFAVLAVREGSITRENTLISIRMKNEFIDEHIAYNIAGMITGKEDPQSYIVFTAHYDHLGMMGNETYFPGANDNASGTAMVLDLAQHYSQPGNQPDRSIIFLALSGEEAGLHGASYAAEHPIVPLEQIRFLINLDMVGTGSDGITVVNATSFEDDFKRMVAINDALQFLPEVKERGESCNSDHCPFYEKGVPSVFIYTRGKEFNEYHNLADRPEDLPLTAYNGLFGLLTNFIQNL